MTAGQSHTELRGRRIDLLPADRQFRDSLRSMRQEIWCPRAVVPRVMKVARQSPACLKYQPVSIRRTVEVSRG